LGHLLLKVVVENYLGLVFSNSDFLKDFIDQKTFFKLNFGE